MACVQYAWEMNQGSYSLLPRSLPVQLHRDQRACSLETLVMFSLNPCCLEYNSLGFVPHLRCVANPLWTVRLVQTRLWQICNSHCIDRPKSTTSFSDIDPTRFMNTLHWRWRPVQLNLSVVVIFVLFLLSSRCRRRCLVHPRVPTAAIRDVAERSGRHLLVTFVIICFFFFFFRLVVIVLLLALSGRLLLLRLLVLVSVPRVGRRRQKAADWYRDSPRP